MRAKNIDFQQGENPFKAMNIGSYKPINVGDEFEILTDIYALGNNSWTDDILRKRNGYMKLRKGEIIDIWQLDNIGKNSVLINIHSAPDDYTAISYDTFTKHPEWFKHL